MLWGEKWFDVCCGFIDDTNEEEIPDTVLCDASNGVVCRIYDDSGDLLTHKARSGGLNAQSNGL